ncbi:MAG: hypothetical protein QME81_11155, partial [bacterium]|nr:hypothetical protein [bacterium]
MSETVSLAEIQEKFDSEWILLEDPETEEGLKVKSGRMLWHSKDRDEVYRKAREFRPKHSAVLCTSKLPQDTVIVLYYYPATFALSARMLRLR